MTALETILASIVTSTACVSALFWLLRTWISERLHQSIAHEYAEKLERHKAELAAEAAVALEKLKSGQAHERAVRALGEDYLREALRAAHTKRIEALEAIWRGILLLGAKTPQALALTDIARETELETMFGHPSASAALSELSMESIHAAVLAPTSDVARHRLASGEYPFALFDAYRTVIGRSAIVIMQSRDDGTIKSWFRDSVVESVLEKVLSTEELGRFRRLELGRLTWIRQTMERKFLETARAVISGRDSAIDAVQQARLIEDAVAAARLREPGLNGLAAES